MTTPLTPPGPWMNRTETAEYLRISVRQLDRLRMDHSYVGSRPLYSREVIDAYLVASRTTPPPTRPYRASPAITLVIPRPRRSRDAKSSAWLDDIRGALRRAA
jgi:hypothetical protein